MNADDRVSLTPQLEVARLQTSVKLRQQYSKAPVNFVTFDEEYLRLLTEGDPVTERHFVSYFSELIRIKLRSRLRSAHLIEEVRQETFLRVLNTLRRRGGLQHADRLGAFVNTVCNNVLMEVLRAETRTHPYPDEEFDPADNKVDVENELVTEERKKLVRTVLASLPPKQRDLLRMVFFEEKDKEEVCRELNVDREYLRVLIHRAKECFRTSFTKGMAAPFEEAT
jgi:RNA polymerase sigma-70 factor, ECF subfamily